MNLKSVEFWVSQNLDLNLLLMVYVVDCHWENN